MNKVKFIIILIAFFFSSVSMLAADSLTVDPITLQTEETKTLNIRLINKGKYRAFQTEITLPKVIDFVIKKDGSADISLSDRAPSSFVINSVLTSYRKTLKIVSYSTDNDVLKGDSGILVKIKVKARGYIDANKITITNTIFTSENNQDNKFPDSESIVYVKKRLTAVVNDASRNYGDDNPNFSITYYGFNDGDAESSLQKVPVVTTLATKVSNVGTYDLDVSGGESERYIFDYKKGTLTINRAPLIISAGNYTKKQGDPMPKFKASYDGFKNDENEYVLTAKPSITTDATVESMPGQYTVNISGAEAQNYDITYRSGTLTVIPGDGVSLTANSYTRVYGDDNPSFEFTSEGATLEGTPEITCEATKNSPVGTYPIVIKQGSVSNYNVSYVNGSLTITKAPLTISAGNYTKKQGDPMPEFRASYEGFKNDENEDVLTVKPNFTTDATVASAPGQYAVNVSGAEAQNYEISYKSGILTVLDADGVVLTANSYTRVYGDDNPTFEFTSEGAPLEGSPEITCEATKNSPVGTYPIVIKQGSVSNYNVSYVNGTLTITKAPLTISAGDYTKKQGDPMPEFRASYEGFKNDENEDVLTAKPNFTTDATVASAPGQYAVNVSGAEAQNYEITYKSGTLTVMAADGVAITANSYTRVYGDDNPTFEFTSEGAPLEGTPEITCEATKNSPVGTYPIVIKQGSVSNYNVSYVNGTLTITKAPLTISAGNYTKRQGAPMPEFKANYDGFKNGENEDVLTSKPSFSTDANENSEPGDYEVRVEGAAAQNYEINYVSGILTVIKKDTQTITWNQDFEVKAGQTVEMTATASSGLPVTYSYYQAGSGGGWPSSDIDGNNITFKDAGARIIVAHQDGNDEYEAAEPDTMYFNVLSEDEADGLMYIDGLYYKYTDDSHTALKVVRGYKSYMGDIVVPLTTNGLPVIALGELAFYTSDKLNSIVIGDNVKEYGVEALSNSYNIRSITFPRKGNNLPDWLCNGSRGIKEIHCRSVVPYPGNWTVFNLDDDFYQGCTLYVPRGTTDAYKASELWSKFANIVEEDVVLTKVDAPVISTDNDVLSITSLTEGATIYYTLDGTEPNEDSRVYSEPVALSASCYIKAFAKRDGLETSEIVNGEYHNAQYPDIVKVGDVFTANIINNGEQNLKEYFEVTSVYPFEVRLRNKSDFEPEWDRNSVSGNVEVPAVIEHNGITYSIAELGSCCFAGISNMTSLKLNEGLKRIIGQAFEGTGIKEIVIPNSVEILEGYNIMECHNLETVVLGSGLQKIGHDAFCGSWNGKFKKLYSLNPVPPVFEIPNNSFEFDEGESLPDDFTLYVPNGSKSAYETAPGWEKLYGHIKEFDPTGIKNITIDKAHADGYWYTLSGVRLDKKPVKEGVYLHDGKKVVIKR